MVRKGTPREPTVSEAEVPLDGPQGDIRIEPAGLVSKTASIRGDAGARQSNAGGA
jgi:hypothetical protein